MQHVTLKEFKTMPTLRFGRQAMPSFHSGRQVGE